MLPKRYKSLIMPSIRLQNITNVISLYWVQICRNKKFFSNLSVGQILHIESDLNILPPSHQISIWSLIFFVLPLFFIRPFIDFSSIIVADISYYNLNNKKFRTSQCLQSKNKYSPNLLGLQITTEKQLQRYNK